MPMRAACLRAYGVCAPDYHASAPSAGLGLLLPAQTRTWRVAVGGSAALAVKGASLARSAMHPGRLAAETVMSGWAFSHAGALAVKKRLDGGRSGTPGDWRSRLPCSLRAQPRWAAGR
jgi:hypothetical protein